MSLLAPSPAVLSRYDAICSLLGARGSGVTLQELGRASELARLLEAEPVDHAHVARLAGELGVDLDALGVVP